MSSDCFAQNEQLRSVTIKDFKGLDTKTSSYDLPKEWADIAENIRYTTLGSIKKRESRSKYNITELGGGNSTGFTYLERIYASSNGRLISAHGEHLMVGHDETGTFSDLKNNITAGLRWLGVTFKKWHYLGNGTDNNQRTDGTKIHTRDMGCPAPTTACTAAIGSGTGLTGAYSYKITFRYDGYQESNGSPASNSVTVTNEDIDLTSIPTSSETDIVIARKIYRTEADGSTYKLVTTITDNTTTTYTDSLADGSLGANIPTDHDIPPNCKYFLLHDERILMAGNTANPSRVYFTDISGVTSYPDIVPTNNFLDIAADDGDEITGLAHDPLGSVCVFKKNNIYRVNTSGKPTQWTITGPIDPHGCISPDSIAETPEGVVYLSRSGERGKELRLFTGQVSRLISERIEPTLNRIRSTDEEDVVGKYHKNKYYMAFNDPNISDVTYNNALLIIDLLRDSFAIDPGKNINCFTHWYGGDDVGELYVADSNEGFVYREDAEDFDVIHDLKSELDEGTYSQQESTGTEANPEIHLIASEISDDFGTTNYEDLTSINYEDYDGDNDTYYPSGSLISAILEVNANNLGSIFWTESLGVGDVQFWVRTGDTSAEIAAASWEGPYSTPAGDSLSAVTGKKYFQYKVKLYTPDTSVVSTPKLYLSGGYVIKATLGLGTVVETTWALNYRTGDLHLDAPFLRKHLVQIRTKHIGTEGTFYIYYRFDEGSESSFAIDLSTNPKTWKKNFPEPAFGETIRLRPYYNDSADFELKEIHLIFSDEPYEY